MEHNGTRQPPRRTGWSAPASTRVGALPAPPVMPVPWPNLVALDGLVPLAAPVSTRVGAPPAPPVMPVPWPEPGQVAAEVSAYATALVNPAPTWPAPDFPGRVSPPGREVSRYVIAA